MSASRGQTFGPVRPRTWGRHLCPPLCAFCHRGCSQCSGSINSLQGKKFTKEMNYAYGIHFLHKQGIQQTPRLLDLKAGGRGWAEECSGAVRSRRGRQTMAGLEGAGRDGSGPGVSVACCSGQHTCAQAPRSGHMRPCPRGTGRCETVLGRGDGAQGLALLRGAPG